MPLNSTDRLLYGLCSSDPRNPNFADHFGDGTDPDNQPGQVAAHDCYCDSCIYGRHPMADELLALCQEVRDLLASFPARATWRNKAESAAYRALAKRAETWT